MMINRCVNKKATTSKTPGDSKTVWIFTNEDDPCQGSEDEKRLVGMVANDTAGNGIDIQLWPLPKSISTRSSSPPFRRHVFFDSITTKNVHNGADSYEDFYLSSSCERMDAGVVFDFDDMLEDVQRQWKKVRRAYSVPLLLPDFRERPEHPGIQLDFFNIIQIQTKPSAVTIHQLTKKYARLACVYPCMNSIYSFISIWRALLTGSNYYFVALHTHRQTIRTTQYVTKDTAEVIEGPRGQEPKQNAVITGEDEDKKKAFGGTTMGIGAGRRATTGMGSCIATFFSFGGERVLMTEKEKALIKSNSNATDVPSLVLIGFKPLNTLSLTQRIGRSYIGYPNDSVIRGSKVAFANLHASMVRKKVYAIGELLVRATATSRLVALYPQQEKRELVGDEGSTFERQVVPPGLILVELPYEDDVRSLDTDPGPIVLAEALQAATQLIRNQQLEGVEFGYDFPNFALAKFSSFLEVRVVRFGSCSDDDHCKKMLLTAHSIVALLFCLSIN